MTDTRQRGSNHGSGTGCVLCRFLSTNAPAKKLKPLAINTRTQVAVRPGSAEAERQRVSCGSAVRMMEEQAQGGTAGVEATIEAPVGGRLDRFRLRHRVAPSRVGSPREVRLPSCARCGPGSQAQSIGACGARAWPAA